ncbi:MAG: FAD-dependent oxidoreductase [Betaproteobacteria bacterium]|nr:FAD-dependent oxidoreductase [Betaproteobacteria bacterium]
MTARPVVVVGAGIVGVSCASYLRREGHEVLLLDRDGPGEGTSMGNAGALSPGSCIPIAMPGVFGKIPGWLSDPEGPLTIRPAYFLRVFPWLVRFTLAARPARVAKIADGLRALHRHVYDCYAPLVSNAGCGDLIHRSGTLNVYRSRKAFESSRSDWKIRTDRGGECRPVQGGELREIEPALAPEFTHAMLIPDHGYVSNPYRLVQVLAAQFVADGGRIEKQSVRTLARGPSGTLRVVLEGGREIEADRVVVAAGAWSTPLVAPLGVRIPLETQRGYHVTIQDAGVTPRVPVAVSEGKYYATPMEGGLRVAGTVEFAGLEAPPNFRRARRLLEQVRELYPAVRTEKFTEWMGHRPCLPDSLPAIGSPRGLPGLVVAYGHGHNGMTSGPVTGRLVADLVAGRRPFIDPSPYSPDRF